MDSNRGTDGQATAPAVNLVVKDNTVEDRFELFANGMPAGVLAYRMEGEKYALVHTEVDPEFEGRGMGSALISRTLDQIRATGHAIVPICPFVSSFLQGHPEYLDLVTPRDRERFDLPSG
jgi:predicted GNAT family acetyltransferase